MWTELWEQIVWLASIQWQMITGNVYFWRNRGGSGSSSIWTSSLFLVLLFSFTALSVHLTAHLHCFFPFIHFLVWLNWVFSPRGITKEYLCHCYTNCSIGNLLEENQIPSQQNFRYRNQKAISVLISKLI